MPGVTFKFILRIIFKFFRLFQTLLTQSNDRLIETSFHLPLDQTTKFERNEVDHNADFVKRMLPKITWSVLKSEAANVSSSK